MLKNHLVEKNFYFVFIRTMFILFVFQSQYAVAENNPLLGTLETRFRELSHAGNLTGCELSFETIAQDYAYKNGTEIMGIGSISLNFIDNKLGVMLKLGTLEVEQFMNENSKKEITAPNYIFLKSKNFNSANQPYVIVESQSIGFKILVLKDYVESLKLIDGIIQQGNFSVGFNSTPNGMDVLLPIDVTVKETIMNDGSFKRVHSDDTLSNFAMCAATLGNKVLKIMGHEFKK